MVLAALHRQGRQIPGKSVHHVIHGNAKGAEAHRVLALAEGLIRDASVGGQHVELEPAGWLCDHLQAALQYAKRESVGGLCGQPETEVLHRSS